MIYIDNAKDLQAFIKKSEAVFVTIMFGNMTWHSKISKKESMAIVDDIVESWNDSTEQLDVEHYASFNETDQTLTLGGF